ncbi:serine-type peptidase [Aureococcus anophagefferens]|nr:serine-type peptidase [Aureococcus anophagefferens]
MIESRLLKSALLVVSACALRPQRLQTPQREPSATQWANAAPQTLEVVAKQCLKTACACMAAANIIALPSAALATPASDGRALVEETVDLLEKYYFDGEARRRPEWLAARDTFGAAAEKNPGAAVRFRGEALKALGADKSWSPLPGSSAAKSGAVKQGDIVDTLNGVKTAGLSSFELLEVIDKSEDKKVATFGVVSDGAAAPRPLALKRDIPDIADPIGRTLYDDDNRLGYGATRYVLDLRGNPGGAFQSAITAASLFLNEGRPSSPSPKADAQNADRERKETFKAKPPSTLAFSGTRPTTSSSGSTAAPRPRRRSSPALATTALAVAAGDRSYGKGKIQAVFGLADSSGLVVTVAQYLTPAGTAIRASASPRTEDPGRPCPSHRSCSERGRLRPRLRDRRVDLREAQGWTRPALGPAAGGPTSATAASAET